MPANKVLIPLNQSELSQEILPHVEKFISAEANELVLFFVTRPPSGAGFGDALNQVAGLSPLPADTHFSATIVLSAGSPGVVNVDWNRTPGANLLDFYGANGTGETFTIVPEPTTAGLLGLGLLSLAVAGRRR